MDPALTQAITQVFARPDVWLVVLCSAAYGVFVGAVPGLTATMAVALFVPVSYWLDPVPALAGIVTMAACAIFAGDIPTVLLRMPGTPASAAYADEAYAFTRHGKGDRVLVMALLCSVVGGVFGSVVLMLLGGQLAKIATLFSVAEYFWLYLLGISCAVVISRGAASKAIFSLMLGLLFSTVGLSAVHVKARFTFGCPQLFQGISFIPAMIGLFGLSEVLRNVADGIPSIRSESDEKPASEEEEENAPHAFAGATRLILSRKLHAVRSSTIGVLVGMLPGAGADIASWISLAASKRLGRKGADQDSSGDEAPCMDGIADATSANNAALAGSWIPALVFGIPGDSVTAIVIGVLLMKNVTPGPKVFTEQAPLVYSIYLIFLLANLILLPVGYAAIKLGNRIVRVPRSVLLPVIVLFCVTGSYALNGSMFDVLIMLGMGLLGFVLERRKLPLGPVVLGIILGGPLEERFIQTLTGAGGSIVGLLNRPVAAFLALVCAGVWCAIAYGAFRQKRLAAEQDD